LSKSSISVNSIGTRSYHVPNARLSASVINLTI
jgi:hypothetical protein